MKSRVKLLAVAASIALLALSACGSDSLSGEPAGVERPVESSVSQDADLSAKLPEKIKSAGVIKIGTDASYAPERVPRRRRQDRPGHATSTCSTRSPRSSASRPSGSRPTSRSIITGVNGKKYDIGISSFTINDERKKQVTMVSYFSAGTQWATAAGNPKGVDPENACGKTIAVQTGTVQDTDDLPGPAEEVRRQQDQHPAATSGQDQATSAVVTGKADAMLADSPVVAYAVKQSGGKLEPLGDVYEAAPYGYVLPKDRDRVRRRRSPRR